MDAIEYIENGDPFHDCEAPPEIDLHQICAAISALQAVNPHVQFPHTHDELVNIVAHAKRGNICTIAWTFDCQDTLNISRGEAISTNRRGDKMKLSLDYVGIQGHKMNEKFKGFLPPQPNVRVYKVYWEQPHTSSTAPSIQAPVQQTATRHTDEDLDFAPMPTLRTIDPEFAACVIAIYRDIIRHYADVSHDERNGIWNRVLSAMKHSLATVRTMSTRKRHTRLTPESNTPQTSEVEEQRVNARATKKSHTASH